jgi:hypothetical protein
MLQESSPAAWDLRAMHSTPNAIIKTYILFLLTVSAVAFVKMMLVWRIVPPFRKARPEHSPAYRALLESTVESLRYWRSLTYQGWGIFASISLYALCDRLLDEQRVGSLLVVSLVEEFSTTLTMALLVALVVFLLQWNLHKRVTRVLNPGQHRQV